MIIGICWFKKYSILGNISTRFDECWRRVSFDGNTNSIVGSNRWIEKSIE